MKTKEETSKIFEQAFKYLNKKFVGVGSYEIIGFLEDFKSMIIDEIKEEDNLKNG